jgi:hypothetical protein
MRSRDGWSSVAGRKRHAVWRYRASYVPGYRVYSFRTPDFVVDGVVERSGDEWAIYTAGRHTHKKV